MSPSTVEYYMKLSLYGVQQADPIVAIDAGDSILHTDAAIPASTYEITDALSWKPP